MCKSLFPVIHHGWESTCGLQILIVSECSSPHKLCVLSIIVAFYDVLCVVYLYLNVSLQCIFKQYISQFLSMMPAV